MEIPSLLREAEHEALTHVTLSGNVLDLGGDRGSVYQALCRGTYTITTLNINPNARPDIVHDLEKPLPIPNATYDNVLLMNVLEHIFNYQELLRESVRVLKPGGQLVILVPFLFPEHPSPEDFYRFASATLRKLCESLGLTRVEVTPLAAGVWRAQYGMVDRLLPWPIKLVSYYTLRYITFALDALTVTLARAVGKRYNPAHYALGYCVVAKKPL